VDSNGTVLFFLPFSDFGFWLFIATLVGRESSVAGRDGLFGFVEERTVGSLILRLIPGIFDPGLVVRCIDFLAVSLPRR